MGNHTTVSRSISAISGKSYQQNNIINDSMIQQQPVKYKHKTGQYKSSNEFKYDNEGIIETENTNDDNINNDHSNNDSDHADDEIISHSVTLIGNQTDEIHIKPNNRNDNTLESNNGDNDIIQGAVTLMGFETLTNDGINDNKQQNDEKDKENDSLHIAEIEMNNENMDEYHWWSYTFNAKNKYIIHIQFKMKGVELNTMKHLNKYRPGVFKKYGARFCTINGKPADIISFKNDDKRISNNVNSYDNNEYVMLKINENIYRLFFVKRIGWCFDDGDGIYINVKRILCGKLPDLNDYNSSNVMDESVKK